MYYDKIIIGAGIYGLYAALQCGRQGDKTVVLEYEKAPFERATYINQARVHMGYHYPRSYSTAKKSAKYFRRFNEEYKDCILCDFMQIYATSSRFSYSNAHQFKKFCDAVGIRCEKISAEEYFKKGKVDGAFLTQEYTYDAKILKEKMLNEISRIRNIDLRYGVKIEEIQNCGNYYKVKEEEGREESAPFILNATYASTNQILNQIGYEPFKIKYELCEIILCEVNNKLKNVGLTVMDGPFFSIMPFGKTGYHSLTSVTFTPHMISYSTMPIFDCQRECEAGFCAPKRLGNCNFCIAKPKTAWPYMAGLARKYMKSSLVFEYKDSLYSMKPILRASEVDDSRPTVIKINHEEPKFISVLSGKINTIYDLDEVFI